MLSRKQHRKILYVGLEVGKLCTLAHVSSWVCLTWIDTHRFHTGGNNCKKGFTVQEILIYE